MTLTSGSAALVATMLIFGADHGVALAQEADLPFLSTSNKPTSTDPVPVFVANEVVQPLPVAEAVAQPGDEDQDTTTPRATSLRELVAVMDTPDNLSEDMRCLAGAIYFEARGEPLAGQLAVAKVVINRKHSPQFPNSYCGVVYQRSQFSFVKRGTMPRIPENSSAWAQAKVIAQIAHYDHWESEADAALYFHANYVKPGWAKRRVAATTINRHIFYK